MWILMSFNPERSSKSERQRREICLFFAIQIKIPDNSLFMIFAFKRNNMKKFISSFFSPCFTANDIQQIVASKSVNNRDVLRSRSLCWFLCRLEKYQYMPLRFVAFVDALMLPFVISPIISCLISFFDLTYIKNSK